MKQRITAAFFNPTAKTVSFANIAGFNVAGLLAIIDGSNVLYVPGTPALALAGVAGSTVTLNAAVSTSGETSADALTIFYDDGASPASAALQPALNGDGGALAHVTNFPATQPVSLAALPALPAGANAIGSVSVSNLPATQTVAGTVAVSNLPATQAVSAASLPLPAGAGTSANQASIIADLASIITALQGSLGVSDAQSAPFAGAVAMTPGTTYAANRSVGVLCSVAGNVEFAFLDSSTITLPVGYGWQTFPFAVTQIVAANTTATAAYFNLK